MSGVCTVFRRCLKAMRSSDFIIREGRRDKEFHFQNWFRSRLNDIGEHHDEPGRNIYPDFKLVRHAEGYELKGLAYPGRTADYDCNSQPPCGEHNGCQVFYVFGRYPAKPDGNRYPVLDLVVCHGSFLNADTAISTRIEVSGVSEAMATFWCVTGRCMLHQLHSLLLKVPRITAL